MLPPTQTFWTFGAFAFLFGTLIGSFLNVVIYRVPAGLSVVTPGSHCPSCDAPIRWYDNIPIVSWFVLGGKCRSCGAAFSIRYAGVEALTGLLAFAAWWQVGRGLLRMHEAVDPAALLPVGGMFLERFTLFALLVTITFIDLDHFIIPHRIAIPGIVLGLLSPWVTQWLMGPVGLQFLWPPVTPLLSIVGAIAGFGLIVGLFYAYWAIRGAEGIGGGDATLMALVGAWLGWPALVFVLFASSLQGVIAAGISMLIGGGMVHDAAEIFADDDEAQEQEDPAEDQDAAADAADDDEATSEALPDEPNHHQGKLAVAFGPFIALSALEFALLGPYLPDELNMIYLYF